VIEAVLFGIIQGLTEFLPISSTAHLTLAGKLLGLITPERAASWTAFMAVLQLGTLIAVIVYFAEDLRLMAASLARDVRSRGQGIGFRGFSEHSRLALLIVLGTIPVVVVGVLFQEVIRGMFTKSTLVIIASLTLLAIVLWIAERVAKHTRQLAETNVVDAIAVGCAQALALIPGSSRSGTTLTAGLLLGLTRPAAARFSFLLSIPAILGSGAFELLTIDPSVFSYGIANLVIATVISAASGYAAIAWLLKFLSNHTTLAFIWYRLALAAVLAVFLASGLIGR